MVLEEEYILANQEILGGIKSAVERGQSLKKAMMTFYQAGYKKEDIENAAKSFLYLQRNLPKPKSLNENKVEEIGEKKVEKNTKEKENPSFVNKTKVPLRGKTTNVINGKNTQKVSAYPTEKKIKKNPLKMITFILIFALLALLGVLAAVFLFKDELINFFNGLFS